jgi:hypothetical protein
MWEVLLNFNLKFNLCEMSHRNPVSLCNMVLVFGFLFQLSIIVPQLSNMLQDLSLVEE